MPVGKFSKSKIVSLLGIGTVILIVDQWSKHLVHTRMALGQSIVLIQDIFDLTYVRNQGAAFGILNSAPSYFRDPFFMIVPVLALFFILFFLYRLEEDQKTTIVALCLIVGGAIGNLIDRIRFGYVIDFVDWHWKEVYHWPAFNIADSCIVVGVSILFIQSFFQGKMCLDPQDSK